MLNKNYGLLAVALSLLVVLLCQTDVASVAKDKLGLPGGWKVWLDGQSLEGWHPLEVSQPNDWQACASVKLNPRNEHFFIMVPGKGALVNGEKGQTVNLLSDMKHGDVEAHIEFAVSKGSNSGIYFMGLYEIQVLDSYGKTSLDFSDCGGIYARWIDEKNVGGVPPKVNASRPPGEWQSFDVQFRAPRFDVKGKKLDNARFLKVIHNGTLIHEGVEIEGPTRAGIEVPEAPIGPLMLQGNHGPVAYRNIRVQSLR